VSVVNPAELSETPKSDDGAGASGPTSREATEIKTDSIKSKHLALISMGHAETHAQSTLYPLVYPFAETALGFTNVDLAILVGASALIGGLLQGLHGWVARWVRRRTLAGGGNIFVGIFLALSSISPNFLAFATARIAGSVASSPQHPIAASLMSDWYSKKKRGSAFSIHFSGGNVGTVLVGVIGAPLLILVGWRGALEIFAIPGIVIGLLVIFFMKDDRKPGSWMDPKSEKKHGSYLSAIKSRNVLVLMLGRFFTSGGRGLGIALTYIPLYIKQQLHYGTGAYGVLFAFLAIGSVFSPIVGGRIADKIGRRLPVIVGSLLLSALATTALILSGDSFLGVATALLGLGLVVFNEGPLSQALLSELTPDEQRDGAFSMYFIISYAGGAMWGFLLGLLISYISFQLSFEVMIVSYVLAAFTYMLVKEKPTDLATGTLGAPNKMA
jgi:MFS family permease